MIPGYSSGDTIHEKDVVNLFSVPDGFVRNSCRALSEGATLYPPLPEINIGPSNEGFTIGLHYQIPPKNDLKVRAPVRPK